MVKSSFEQLKSFIERVERLEEEKSALAADVREVYAEANGTGFDTKIMRMVIALRKLDKAAYQEQEAMLDLYKDALGMGDTPLGHYAERVAPAAPKKSQAKADADAPSKANTKSAGGEESVSRGADARSSAATSERMDATGGESATLELPAFMDRRAKPPPQPVV